MSILAHRVTRTYLLPTLVSTAQGIGSTNTYTVTPAVTPTSGNMIIITGGGTQNRTVVTPPTGFTTVATAGGVGGTNVLFWKIAGGSEPASYSIVWSGILGGGWTFTELKNIADTSPVLTQVGGGVAPGTSLALPSYDVTVPSYAITYASKSSTSAWTANNSFGNVNPSGQHKVARRRYTVPAFGEVTTWSGTSETVLADLVVFKGYSI